MRLLALSALLALQAQARRPEQGAGPEVGQPAPAFKLKGQDGKLEVDSEKLKGKPALLIFGSYT